MVPPTGIRLLHRPQQNGSIAAMFRCHAIAATLAAPMPLIEVMAQSADDHTQPAKVETGDVDAPQWLLLAGVAPNSRSDQGLPVPVAAISVDPIEIARLAPARNAGSDAVDRQGMVAFAHASSTDRNDLIRILQAPGAK